MSQYPFQGKTGSRFQIPNFSKKTTKKEGKGFSNANMKKDSWFGGKCNYFVTNLSQSQSQREREREPSDQGLGQEKVSSGEWKERLEA